MRSFIAAMPKAELHLHIEGTFEPELMFEIARRNKVSLKYSSAEDLRKAYQFNNLQEFLDIYYAGANVLLHEVDFYDLTYAYLKKSHEQNVRHAEIMFDPQTHTERGVAFATVINGIWNALRDAERDFGISSVLIMSFVRHLPEASAIRTLEEGLQFRDYITAVGLDSSEVGNPPSKFREVFRRAADEGLLLQAHAGEEGPPAYIHEALDLLNVGRIDHGNRCLEDAALVALLRESRRPMTICPLSNLCLRGVTDMLEHPLKKMLDASLMVTVNSDDPAYFGGYMNENYFAVQEALNLNKRELYALARNGFDAAYLPEARKKVLMAELDGYFEGVYAGK